MFTACLNLDMIDPHLWSLLASLDQPSPIVVLSGFVWFTTYYAVSVADTILRFSLLGTDRTDFPELCAMNECLPPRDFDEVHVFPLRTPNSFLDEVHRTTLIQKDNQLLPGLEDIEMPALTPKTDRGCVLRNVHAVLGEFDGRKVTPTIDDREVIEYKVYISLVSFVHALVRLVQLLPPVVDYNNAFLLSEFLPKLQAAARDAGIRTKQHALPLLGELICRPSTVPLLEPSAIAE
jgi:hypothetical protein